jgi:hypothetical protein
VYTKGSNEYPDLQYTSHQGGYPLVFVSQGKHANYKGLIECNHSGGGPLPTDTCEGNNTRVRVETHSPWVFPGLNTTWYNIGSRAVHDYYTQDCVPSRNSTLSGNGRLECYWTAQRFRGWYPYDDDGDADSYSGKLAAKGFVAPPPPSGVNLSGPTMMGPRDACWWYATAYGGTPPYTYSWQGGSFVETTDGTSGFVGTGPIHVMVSVTDAVGVEGGASMDAQVDENVDGCY